MDVLTSETCWALNNEIIKEVTSVGLSLFDYIKMMHGPINIKLIKTGALCDYFDTITCELRICWISSRAQPRRGGPTAWRLGEVLITDHLKKSTCHEPEQTASDLGRSFGRAVGNTTRKIRVPQTAGNSLTSWRAVSFSRKTLLYGLTNLVSKQRFN